MKLVYTITYNLLFCTIMLPIYLKSGSLFNSEILFNSINLFLKYFFCSVFATLIIILYVIIVATMIQRFNLQNHYWLKIIMHLQNSSMIYTKIIAWKLILIFCNIKLGYFSYSLFLASLYYDSYMNYFISISNKYRSHYLLMYQYHNNIIDELSFSFYLHNKYCLETVFATFYYCICDEWILFMFEYVNQYLVKITNFNLRILDNFINTESITFIFHYNIILFITQIIYLLLLHNYIKKQYY